MPTPTYSVGQVDAIRHGAFGASPTKVTGFKQTGWKLDPMEKQQLSMMQQQEEQSEERMQMAEDIWDQYQEGVETANEEARESREEMLSKIEAYEEGYNEDWIDQTLQREKANWDVRRQQTLERVQNQYAQMGRTPDPYILGEINRQLVAKEQDALMKRRFQLEQERSARQQWALEARMNVDKMTRREVVQPQQAMQMAQQMGKSAAEVQPAVTG